MKNQLLMGILVGLSVMAHGCKKDDATPTGPAAPTNSFSFNTDDGNFSASGAFSSNANSGSGAAWMSSNIVAAYAIVSPTDVSVVTMVFLRTPAVGTFNFPTDAAMTWSFHVNPNDTASVYANQCVTRTGSMILTAHGAGTSQGTFGGTGTRVRNQAYTCGITNGAFTLYSGNAKATLPPEVERIARRMVEHMEH
jgi:hypothetical protein